MGELTCQWCDGAMTAEARGRYTNPPEDGPDAWAAALTCSSCGATGPWGKGDTRAEAIASAEHRARTLLRHVEVARLSRATLATVTAREEKRARVLACIDERVRLKRAQLAHIEQQGGSGQAEGIRIAQLLGLRTEIERLALRGGRRMSRPLCYIAAPYAHPSPVGLARNVDRAILLGRLAISVGLCPIVPHALVPALVGSEVGRPEVRAVALDLGLDLLDGVIAANGRLYVLTRDDGTLSPGVEAEVRRFHTFSRSRFEAATWQSWGSLMALHGLHDEWRALV